MGKIDDREQDLLDLIKTRRSIRQFTSDPVPAEVLREIVHAGIWAPTGSNQQEVRFYVTTDPADIRALWTAKPHIKNPQAAILVYVDLSGEYYQNLRQRLHTLQLPLMDVG
ncbi:MAG: nitroreductase family protein, partial [Deltaproteobacteria bacterium]|nr:nitroreductase family protein [Deltaproteobacteria bacterium]